MSKGLKFPFARIANAPLPAAADKLLNSFSTQLAARKQRAEALERSIVQKYASLEEFANAHRFFGLHCEKDEWVFREYAPHAESIVLAGDFSNWNNDERFRLKLCGGGIWEGRFPKEAIQHGMHYCMRVKYPRGGGERLPAYLRRAVQDEKTLRFTAQVLEPESKFTFRYPRPEKCAPLIYEAHIGIAQEAGKVGSFAEFMPLLEKIARKGYNTIQLMGIMEHPYYGSFGYHVSNFFAVSSRFGTPEDFKHLVDEAHRLDLRVVIDLVHSHAVKNVAEGLGDIDGCRETYFHAGARGIHEAWDSLCFDYSKMAVLQLLLSNCRYFLEEFNIDGFRFDGVTSMIYKHHGLNKVFCSYEDYFSSDVDDDALVYLTLANKLIHRLYPGAVTIAEDVSGMPLLASSDGVGFDYRLAMGVSDIWFKLLDIPDEKWSMHQLYNELLNRRGDERSISYVECHDQSIVGGQTAFFRMAGAAVYDSMQCGKADLAIDRAMALHKLMRLITAATAGHGYVNFIGNEFGHPEWVDFPREGNNWSYQYARRQWSLEADGSLRYRFLSDFDKEITKLISADGFYDCRVQTLRVDEERKLIAFERNELYFIFNFNSESSFTDHEIEVPSGIYRTILDSDAEAYGGFDRRTPGQEYSTIPRREGLFLSLYLPSRSVLVLQRQPMM